MRDDHPVPEEQAVEALPARVVEVYDQMMRQVIGPALRRLGFRGTAREFKYGSHRQFGVLRRQKDGRFARARYLYFTGNVNYWCGADRIGFMMPVPANDTWREIPELLGLGSRVRVRRSNNRVGAGRDAKIAI